MVVVVPPAPFYTPRDSRVFGDSVVEPWWNKESGVGCLDAISHLDSAHDEVRFQDAALGGHPRKGAGGYIKQRNMRM